MYILSYNLTLDDLWPTYVTFNFINIMYVLLLHLWPKFGSNLYVSQLLLNCSGNRFDSDFYGKVILTFWVYRYWFTFMYKV